MATDTDDAAKADPGYGRGEGAIAFCGLCTDSAIRDQRNLRKIVVQKQTAEYFKAGSPTPATYPTPEPIFSCSYSAGLMSQQKLITQARENIPWAYPAYSPEWNQGEAGGWVGPLPDNSRAKVAYCHGRAALRGHCGACRGPLL